MPFTFDSNELGLIHLTSRIFKDDRGYFCETYKKSEFKKLGIDEEFPQENVSFSKKNVLRGLHYQKNPHAQGKLVACLKGSVLDVGVDIRKGSPTYGKWKSYILTAESGDMLYVPVGYAHGFLTLSDETMIMYKGTSEYSPESEGGIVWNDPDLAIDWGISNPIVIDRDANLPKLADADNNFVYQE